MPVVPSRRIRRASLACERFLYRVFASSEYRKKYLGDKFLPEKMGHMEVGPKEMTGPVRNEAGHVQSFDDPRRFVTTYQVK